MCEHVTAIHLEKITRLIVQFRPSGQPTRTNKATSSSVALVAHYLILLVVVCKQQTILVDRALHISSLVFAHEDEVQE